MSWFTEYAAFFNIAQIVQLWVTDKTRQRSDLIQNVVYDQVRRDIFIGPICTAVYMLVKHFTSLGWRLSAIHTRVNEENIYNI